MEPSVSWAMRSMLSQLAACTSGCSSRSPQRITGQAQFGKNGQMNALTAQKLHSVSNFLLVGRNIPQMNGQTDGGNAGKAFGHDDLSFCLQHVDEHGSLLVQFHGEQTVLFQRLEHVA